MRFTQSLARWRAARRTVLGTIVLSGALATSVAIVHRVVGHDCSAYHRLTRAYTYSGIGVVIERGTDGSVVVRRVIPGGPAHGKLTRGAHFVSVDGTTPDHLAGWATAIRGEPGTEVEIEVAHPCSGHEKIKLTRGVVRVEY